MNLGIYDCMRAESLENTLAFLCGKQVVANCFLIGRLWGFSIKIQHQNNFIYTLYSLPCSVGTNIIRK